MIVSLTTSCVFHAWPHASPTIPKLNLHRSSPPLNSSPRCYLRRSLSSGRPPPPQSEPPNESNSSGPASTTRLQENTRIFFAVLFWMALFFWSSVWDGRNNDGGTRMRPRKGSWFRK